MTPSMWHEKGTYISYGPHQLDVFYMDIGDTRATPDDTLLILHGFPESSYSFHKVLDDLMSHFDRIVLFDMIGYGFSAKPAADQYGYSLVEQADVALTIWRSLDISGGHLLAHDMGNSVATELVARQVNQTLPHNIQDAFKSVTLTNGSVVLSLAKLRITQKLLLHPKWGPHLSGLFSAKIFKQQVLSAHGTENLSTKDIMDMWDMNQLNDGHLKTHLTIQYLNDRKKFERTRWLPALRATQLPIHLCWGDKDQVARVEMVHHLKEKVCPQATLTIMKGLGHFCQLDELSGWSEAILGYYRSDTIMSLSRSMI